MRLGDVQRHGVDPTADQRAAASEQELRCDAERPGDFQRTAFAPKQQIGQSEAPPRDLVKATQHGIHFAGIDAKMPAFDGREHVALEHDAVAPASAKLLLVVASIHGDASSTKFNSLGSVRQSVADPADEIGQCTFAERALLYGARNARPKLREQTEIDIHRLKRSEGRHRSFQHGRR